MRPTEAELHAARRLGEALADYIVALENGAARRRSDRPAELVTVQVEQPTPSRPAWSAPVDQTEPARPPARLLVTPREAARLLSVGERKLWEITEPRGPIPVVRLGRLVRYPVEDLSMTIARMKTSRQ